VSLTLNGIAREAVVRPDERLVDVVRDTLGHKGTKIGCETGHCGACTVLLDGNAVCSCLVLAPECDGREVVTVEGIGGSDALNAVQSALVESTAVQCGYCTPGFVIAATALLDENPTPSEAEIRAALVGNLCRCTGYEAYVRAVMAASRAGRNVGTHA
jgi:carbon-monoxide dehydrogenase small subunit